MNPTLSIITLNTNLIIAPTKRQNRQTGPKSKIQLYAVYMRHTLIENTKTAKVKECTNFTHERAGVAVFISN